MTIVVKRGGKRKQTFSKSKILTAIKQTCKEAKFSPSKTEATAREVGNKVISLFSKKRVVKSTDIRKSILGRLTRINKSLASKWKMFEKKKRK